MNKQLYPLLALIAILCTYSCKSDKTEPTAQVQSGTLNIAKKTDPQKLHPFIYPSPKARDIYQYIFPQLADFNPKSLQFEPVLLTAIPEEEKITSGPYKDGVKFKLEILPEAKWDDGSEVTAHDYMFSVKAAKNHLSKASGYRAHLKFISEVNIDPNDPKKMEVVFAKDYLLAKETAITIEVYPEYVYDPQKLHRTVSFKDIGSKEFVEKLASEDNRWNEWAEAFNGVEHSRNKVVSCGPYKLKEWVTNEYVILERKENYWGKNKNAFLSAYPQEIIFHILPDQTASIAQLKEGTIDMVSGLTGATFEDLKKEDSELAFYTPRIMKYYMIALNNDSPELSDPKVRKALAHLLDVQNIIDAIDYGYGQRTIGPIHPDKEYYNDDLKPIEYNLEKAKSLLAEQGWKDSNANGILDKRINGELTELELDIYVSEGKLGQQISLLLQEALGKVNGKLNIIQKPFKEIQKKHYNTRKYDLTPVRIGQDLVLDDPYTRWHSEQDTPNGRNKVGYQNDRMDQITKEIQTIQDPAKRNELYKEVQKILYEDQPCIFLYAPSERFVINKKWSPLITERRPGYMANNFKLK